jgi:hypothetical protein
LQLRVKRSSEDRDAVQGVDDVAVFKILLILFVPEDGLAGDGD